MSKVEDKKAKLNLKALQAEHGKLKEYADWLRIGNKCKDELNYELQKKVEALESRLTVANERNNQLLIEIAELEKRIEELE
jgi:hypothetical protein